MTETSTFLDAIAELDHNITGDRRAARRTFTTALTHATPAEREVLDDMVDTFTLYPYRTALLRLDAAFRYDEPKRALLTRLLPGTDPGLHVRERAERIAILDQRARANGSSVDDEAFRDYAPLTAAETDRTSIRLWRNPPARVYLAPSRATDKSRMTPEQITARVRARGKRRPALVEPDVVAAYVADNLHRDTMAGELARIRASEQRFRDLGLLAEPTPSSAVRVQGAQPRSDEDVRARWDLEFVHHVADQHAHDAANAEPSRRISHDNALAYAEARTGVRGDLRPEVPFQGNSVDYTREAMTPISGWRCVACFIERSTRDQDPIHSDSGRRRSDDGLCDYCRGDDRTPRLPELPTGFTATDLARTYCRFLTTTHPGAAPALLAETRRRAPRWLISIIDEFSLQPEHTENANDPLADVETDAAQAKPPTPRRRGPMTGAGQRQARCEGCTRIRAIHDDGFCTECRVWLGLVTPPTRQTVAA
ncbi:hypothetical protein [Nocardia cerradoensis]|uniref:Uncharacterized protein n=1 Tax=Nocardia cerradoensis TaxID=85688 RepID=A0A231GT12_9NOCA|nr:hypothetical protein [Nocardia cerradoensis]NKY43551.1 hypothetical protein [Nocardia cerradoensis]OXR39763.1 hypothetical protein B7C42_08164 [Nocardia cerradoensis]